MKKSTYLGLALLFCATNGHAQVKIGSFAELTAVKDSLAKVKVYEEELGYAKTANSTFLNAANEAEATKTETSTKTETTYFAKGTAEKTAISAFYGDAMLTDNPTGEYSLKISRSIAKKRVTLSVYAPGQPTPDGVEVETIVSNAEFSDESTLIKGDNTATSIASFILYVANGDGTYSTTTVAPTVKPATDYDALDALITASNSIAESYVPTTKEITTTTTTRINSFLTKWQTLYNNENLQSYLNAALDGGKWTVKTVAWKTPDDQTVGDTVVTVTTYGPRRGCREYTDLQLTDNIIITDADFSMDIAAGYTFDGAGKAITGMDGRTKALFGTNNGTISNVVLYSGCTLVGDNEGKISNVTVGAGQNGTVATTTVAGGVKNSISNPSGTLYNVYASDGTTASVDGSKVATYPNIYNNATLRNEFSVNVVNGIVSKGSVYKLYEVKAYSANLKEGQKRIVNINANGAITTNGNDSWSSDLNGAFYYVTDADAAEFLADVEVSNAQPNVVYTTNGTDWYCKKATVYNDGTPIYIHEAFEAESVNYNRTFTVAAEGASTICLPFAVSESELGNILGTNGKLLQFNKIEENGDNRTYWFKYVSGGMEANQPYILKFGEAVSGQIFNLKNVKFNATGSANLASLEQSMEGVGASLCGTFKKQTASELEAGRYSIYGFQNGEFVRMTDGVVFNPTRAYVRREGFIPSTSSSAKSYKLGILDENDNEVTAISTVEKAAGAFAVKGGNGVITVNSDKAQNVKVYTAGGALVKNVAVSAGEVSIPVAAGLYIVNGSKVVVK